VNQSRNKPLTLAIAAAIAATSGAPGMVFAQGAVEEIVVTARQREEALQDVPASITVLTARDLERAGVERAADFVKLTPGVSMVNAAEVGDTQVNIRGINGARDAENSFAFIVDGILQTNTAAFNREYTNLQQIEILKGPQSALYGRNAAAGAIIVTTEKPGDEFEARLKGSVAEDSTYYGNAYLAGPLGNTAGWSVDGVWRESDGYYSNSFTGDDSVDDFEDWAVNGRFVWDPTDELSVDVKASYGEVDASAISFNAAFALPGFAGIGLPGGEKWFEDVNDHDFEFQNNIDPQNDQESKSLSVKVDYDMDWATMTAWTFYSDIDNSFSADGTSGAFGFFNDDPTCEQTVADQFNAGVVLPAPQILAPTPEDSLFGPYTPTACDGTQYQERNQDDFSAEIRFASPGDQRLRWLAGGYFLTLEREVGVNLGVDTGNGVTESLYVPQGNPNWTESLVWDEFDTDVWAVFGQLAYDVIPTVEAALALRYDVEDREVNNKVPAGITTVYVPDGAGGANLGFDQGFPLNPGQVFTDPFNSELPSKKESWDKLQPKVSLRWDINYEWTAYTSWGVGFKSGGFNNSGSQATVDLFYNGLLGNPDDPQSQFYNPVFIQDEFDEETSSAFEIGVKSELMDGRLSLEGAYYYTKVDDMQFFEFLVGPFGLLRTVSNIDEVEIQGFEVGANWAATDWFSLSAGFNYTDSEIQDNSSRPQTEGNESPYTPEYNGNVAALFDYPIGRSGLDLIAGVYYTLVGPTWFHTVQGSQRTLFDLGFPGLGVADYGDTERDDYYTIDLRFGVEGENWSAVIYGTNITDEDYLEEVIPAPEFGGSFVHVGTKDRWGLEVSYRF
jgi:iron complex outermembrane receptor protein